MDSVISGLIETSLIGGAFIYMLHYFLGRFSDVLESVSNTLSTVSETLYDMNTRLASIERRMDEIERKEREYHGQG